MRQVMSTPATDGAESGHASGSATSVAASEVGASRAEHTKLSLEGETVGAATGDSSSQNGRSGATKLARSRVVGEVQAQA